MNGQYNPGDIVLGHWTLIKLVGEGSFGRVFEAEREDFGRIYKQFGNRTSICTTGYT